MVAAATLVEPLKPGAIHVLDSQVTKLADAEIGERVSTTYASIVGTCPASCELRDRGCYGQDGNVAHTMRRLDAAVRAAGWTAMDIALQEAEAIEAVCDPDGRPMRLHVIGDCKLVASALLVAGAAGGWVERGGGPVWTYTHAWRVVPRAAWQRVSVLGSVDHISHGAAALRAGYAPAAITGPHPMNGRAFERDGVTWIPCPNQTRGRTCTQCRLCWDADRLHAEGKGITFAAHGRPRLALQLPLIQ